MVRWALFLLLAFGPLAWAQTLRCLGQEVRFDFSANVSGDLPAPDGLPYPRAGLPNYLSFLDTLPPTKRFLPTQVVGTQSASVICVVFLPQSSRGRGGSLCGAGPDWCLRLQVAGGLLPPLARDRVYVLGRMARGMSVSVTSHVPTPTPLSSIPDGGGLFSISPGRSRISFAFLEIWIFLEFSASDSYSGPYSGSLLFTYVLKKN